jgi:hypothetical protein
MTGATMVLGHAHELGDEVLLGDQELAAMDAAQGVRPDFRTQAPRSVPPDGFSDG